MVEALTILTEELRRLKALGVKRVPVSLEALQGLRAALASAPGEPARDPAPAVAPAGVPEVSPAATVRSAAAPVVRAAPKLPKPEPERLLPLPPVVKPTEGTKEERLAALAELISNDPVCREQVRAGRKLVVGVGSVNARLFLCGEAPGAEEEVQGLPFVGPAGQKLSKMIEAMGVRRDEAYIANIMTWRPQLPTAEGQEQIGNRPPTPEEMAYCLPYLQAQLDIVQPEVVVALGATAAKGLLGEQAFKALQDVRGQWQTYRQWPVMVTYHPSYVLRMESQGIGTGGKAKRAVWEDLLKVMERLNLPISEKQRRYFL